MTYERIHKEKEVRRAKFLFALQESRGPWCGEIHQPCRLGALSFYGFTIKGIKKGWGAAVVWPLGCWGLCTTGGFRYFCISSNVTFCLQLWVAVIHILFLLSSIFQSWGHKLRRVKWQSCLTRSRACLANGAKIANGAGFILPLPTIQMEDMGYGKKTRGRLLLLNKERLILISHTAIRKESWWEGKTLVMRYL